MKRLGDYTGDEAIEVVGELLEPMGVIYADEEIVNELQSGKPIMSVAGKIINRYKKEVKQMIEAVDKAEISGTNVFPRFIAVFSDLTNSPDFENFFGSAMTKTE